MEKGFVYLGQHRYGIFHRFEVYYNPRHNQCWGLATGDGDRYFTRLGAMIDYLLDHRMLHTAEPVRVNLLTQANRIEAAAWSRLRDTPESWHTIEKR